MKSFRLWADARIDAENIDEVLKKLARHFLACTLGAGSDVIAEGEVHISPIEEDKP